jgi:dTDP-4-dehydrorhamnose reductase
LDIGDAAQVAGFVADFKPQLIINAAAYTAVDKAETEQTLANTVNAEGPANLARAAAKQGAIRVLHISTDFVFDGCGSSPYRTTAATAPLGVYGTTKLAGEQAVLNILGTQAVVVRTAWVYAAQGQNFVRTMLRLMNERGAVRVVADQVGTPTSAASLASVLWMFVSRPDLSGVFHWTDAGVASWYDFAVAIAEEATAKGLLQREVQLTPIATTDYPTPAKRPAYSVLDKQTTIAAFGIPPVHWRTKLREVLEELAVA